jgi:hypothetical protein
VTETVIPAGNNPYGAKWLDLLMPVIGGRERNEADWRTLLDGAGFRRRRRRTGMPGVDCASFVRGVVRVAARR